MSEFLTLMIKRIADPDFKQLPPLVDSEKAPPNVTKANRRGEHLEVIIASRLFDGAYYLQQYPDIAEAGIDALEHFFDSGYLEDRRPNAVFAPIWYLDQNSDVRTHGFNPLYHYAQFGEKEGRRPAPLFDPQWYRERYKITENLLALTHYLDNRHTNQFSPLGDFDIEYYAENNPDVVAAKIDLFDHFCNNGVREGRNPSADFDIRFYTKRYLKGDPTNNPFLHYLANKHLPGIHARRPDDETTIAREVRYFSKPGRQFEELRPVPASMPRRAKILAYYLPQFHSFPENDGWWGKGFTEWTNVARGLPRFKGHYQPRVPRDLGFYTLEGTETLRRQAEIARAGGVHGFIFYYYWFNGKRLMERPIDAFLSDPSIDIPFALMWANENWTRRWDGLDSEILISQDYRVSDDEFMVAEYARHFRDPRYIRLEDNRPLLAVYRPGIIPEASTVITRWRELFRTQFDENPILVMAQGFGDSDPNKYGLDGAIEFPPHKVAGELPPLNPNLTFLDDEFSGLAISYDDVVTRSLAEAAPSFPLIRGVLPSWDNDARRQGSGMVIHGSTPAKYEAWLTDIISRAGETKFFGESIVVVNAWNEWAEGTYLEPDIHFGGAYLNATGRAAVGMPQPKEGAARILLIGHDAHPHGAQELLLHIGAAMRHKFGLKIEFLLLEGGPLEKQYSDIGKVTVATAYTDRRNALSAIQREGFSYALVNTAAASHIVKLAHACGISCINLIHELPRFISERKFEPMIRESMRYSRAMVFPAPFVRDAVLKAVQPESITANIIVQPQGVYKPVVYSEEAGEIIRKTLGIAKGEHLVLGVGYGDLRKGFDLFLQLWRVTQRTNAPRVHFCWLGRIDGTLKQWIEQDVEDAIRQGSFHTPGFTTNVQGYMSASSVMALTSREDPFPSVALEALSCGVPVVAFERSGGIPDLLSEHQVGQVAPYADVPVMAGAIWRLIEGKTDEDVASRQKLMQSQFDWGTYVSRLVNLVRPDIASVSVAIPNYNYAQYLPSRMGSVFAQAYPLREVLVLDDCSKDNSLEVIPQIAAEWDREIILLPNDVNSGSVFTQWRKAAGLAKGEFIWIAEGDDLSDPEFVPALVEQLQRDPSVVLAFSDSRSIDTNGAPLGPSYKSYYSTSEPGALSYSEVFEAREFVARFLSVRNLILNVSAVVWRRDVLLRALDVCQEDLTGYRMAGDWRLYLQALSEDGARVAYEARALNVHRRHAQSVTHALQADQHVAEIAKAHQCAREMFGLPSATVEMQIVYLRDVSGQLGASGNLAEATLRKAKTDEHDLEAGLLQR